MKSVICGAGQMGLSTIWAMRELGFEVDVIDTSSEALNKVREYFTPHPTSSASRDRYPVHTYVGTAAHWTEVIKNADIVISTLPYHANYNLAIICVNNNVAYCDLGGHVRTSQSIHKYIMDSPANEEGVFTDLGLAPGWINIIAEAGYQAVKEHRVDNIEMYVGGLPCNPGVNPMGYVPTWSIDGLMNEYDDKCLVLDYGSIKKVDGMSDVHDFRLHGTRSIIQMESFNTSGGAAHTIEAMCARMVKRCVYNTIRYKGHRDFYKWLQHIMSKKNLKSFLEQVQESDKCADMVIMEVGVGCDDGATWYDTFVYDQDTEGSEFSAMQVCTTMPLATVASMMARGKLPAKSILSYEDVPFDEFEETVHMLIHKQKEWYIGE